MDVVPDERAGPSSLIVVGGAQIMSAANSSGEIRDPMSLAVATKVWYLPEGEVGGITNRVWRRAVEHSARRGWSIGKGIRHLPT